jgi:hypothetical protein
MGGASSATDRYGGFMKNVLRLVVLSLIAVASFAAAQPNTETSVQVKLRGVLRVDVNVTDVVFDFTDEMTIIAEEDSRSIYKASDASLAEFWDGTGLITDDIYMFAPTSMVGTSTNDNGTPSDPSDDFANDYGVATVIAGGNAQWTLSAALDAGFEDVPNTLIINTEAGDRQKSTADYTYHEDEASRVEMSDIAQEIAKAEVGSTPAGANGITEVKLWFGYELDLTTIEDFVDPASPDTELDETQVITYSLTNP